MHEPTSERNAKHAAHHHQQSDKWYWNGGQTTLAACSDYERNDRASDGAEEVGASLVLDQRADKPEKRSSQGKPADVESHHPQITAAECRRRTAEGSDREPRYADQEQRAA